MNRVTICVIDDQSDTSILKKLPYKDAYGFLMSNKDKVLVNRVKNGYSIIFKASDFVSSKLDTVWTNIAIMFKKNLPDTDLAFITFPISNTFSVRGVHEAIMMMNRIIEATTSQDNALVEHMHFDGETYTKMVATKKIKFPSEDKVVEEEEEEFDPWESLGYRPKNDYHGRFDDDDYDDAYDEYEDEDDDEDDEDDEYKSFEAYRMPKDFIPDYSDKKKKKKSYAPSRVLKNCKSPKTAYNRHGVMIANKNDIIKDAKMIKSFLKQFIPGNSKWKKDFRDDILGRWIASYVITKKKLNKYQREMKKNERADKIDTARKLIGSAMSMMSRSNDLWNDPNR